MVSRLPTWAPFALAGALALAGVGVAAAGGFGPAQGTPAGNITGQVGVVNGGTGVAVLTTHGVLLGEGTATVSAIAPVASGSVVASAGTTADYAAVTLARLLDAVGGSTPGTLLARGSTTTGYAGLPDVSTGQVLASGGVGSPPAYTSDPLVTSIYLGASDTRISRQNGGLLNATDGATSKWATWGQGGFWTTAGGSIGFTDAALDSTSLVDTRLSRSAAGVTRFGTTANNASGSWQATDGALSGPTTHGLLLGEGTSNITAIAPVASGSLVASAGTSSDYQAVAAGQLFDQFFGATPGLIPIRGSTTAGYVGRTLVTGDLPSLTSVAVTSLTAGTNVTLTGGPTGAITVNASGGSQTWAQVLSSGNTTGATNPVVSAGSGLGFNGASPSANGITFGTGGGNVNHFTGPSDQPTQFVSGTPGSGAGKDFSITAGSGVGSAGGGSVLLNGGTPGSTGQGGNVTLRAGNGGATSGLAGQANLFGGNGGAGGGLGGAVLVSGGTGTGGGVGGAASLVGGDGGTPGAVTMQGGTASFSNAAGSHVTLQTGLGTGTGTPGSIYLISSFKRASGSTAQSSCSRALFSGATKALTNNTETTFATITLSNDGDSCGGTVSYEIRSQDGTGSHDQTARGSFHFTAHNNAGTVTGTVGALDEAQETGSGTLVDSQSQTAAATVLSLKLKANSSLTTTTLDMTYTILLDGPGTVAEQ